MIDGPQNNDTKPCSVCGAPIEFNTDHTMCPKCVTESRRDDARSSRHRQRKTPDDNVYSSRVCFACGGAGCAKCPT